MLADLNALWFPHSLTVFSGHRWHQWSVAAPSCSVFLQVFLYFCNSYARFLGLAKWSLTEWTPTPCNTLSVDTKEELATNSQLTTGNLSQFQFPILSVNSIQPKFTSQQPSEKSLAGVLRIVFHFLGARDWQKLVPGGASVINRIAQLENHKT